MSVVAACAGALAADNANGRLVPLTASGVAGAVSVAAGKGDSAVIIPSPPDPLFGALTFCTLSCGFLRTRHHAGTAALSYYQGLGHPLAKTVTK